MPSTSKLQNTPIILIEIFLTMFGLYFRIWANCIYRLKSQPANKKTWKAGSMILMTLAMSMNMLLLLTVFQRYVLHKYYYKFDVPEMSTYANNVLLFIILYVFPCFMLNYFLIFRNDRYKSLLKIHQNETDNLFITYFVISMALPVILLWTGIIISKVG